MQLHEFQTSYRFQNSPCVLVCTRSCPTLCSPMDCSLPGSCPWNFPGKNSEVGCHLLFQGVFPTTVLHDLPQLTPSELSPPFCPYSLHIHTLFLSVPIQVAPTSGTLHCLFPCLEYPAWDLSLLFFTQVKTQMSIPQWRPCSLQLPIILLYFPHRTYCYPPPKSSYWFVYLLIVCLSRLSISSNLAWIHH